MNNTWHRWGIVALIISGAGTGVGAFGQSTPNYDSEIQQGTAQLQTGQADAALAAGRAAIGQSPERWDGYALTGRALLVLKHYEAAADALSEAIERAPSAQQQQLRQWRRDALLPESGDSSVAPSAPSAASAASAPPAPRVAAAAPPPAPAIAPSPPPPAAVRATPVARATPAVSEGFGYPTASDAAWTDARTGLTWARPWYYPRGTHGPWDYAAADAFCHGLRLLGYADWRLPSLAEVQTVYLVSAKGWRWSKPKFEPAFGVDEALDEHIWRIADFTVDGDHFNGNRLLLWTSTPGDRADEHAAVYFGRRYSVRDEEQLGSSVHGSARNPFHAYAFCVRSAPR